MKTFAYQSSYLLPPSRQSTARLTKQLWRRSLRTRRLHVPTIIGLASWLLVIIFGSWTIEHHSLSLPQAVGGTTALAANASVETTNTLPGGPVGGVLPPGTLAAYRTYANSYSGGQCTWYVASRRPIPSGWGNANTWLGSAQRAGWSTGTTPALGAIAWTSAGYYGHVALVENISGNQVEVTEMNYLGPYRIDDRWTSASSWRYIY